MQLSNDPTGDVNQKEVMLTSDDFQQHTKAQAKLKQKFIEISDTPAAIEFAKYALMSDFRSSDETFQCPKCLHSCTRFYDMRSHIFTHLKEKIFTCMFCKKKSNRLLRMEWHVSDHVKNNSRKTFERLVEMVSEKSNDQHVSRADAMDGKINEQLAIVRKRLNLHCIQLADSSEGIVLNMLIIIYCMM